MARFVMGQVALSAAGLSTAALSSAIVLPERALPEGMVFESIVQTYRAKIFRFALASLPDRDIAETITQDCFLKAHRAWETFRNECTERQRTVFLLRFVEDRDLLEIAASTGMKEGTVKTHLFRALNAVRAQVQP